MLRSLFLQLPLLVETLLLKIVRFIFGVYFYVHVEEETSQKVKKFQVFKSTDNLLNSFHSSIMLDTRLCLYFVFIVLLDESLEQNYRIILSHNVRV